MELTERDRQVATWYSLSRAAVGGAFVLAPGLMKGWIGGADAARPQVKLLARGFGVRDMALGLGAYLALSSESGSESGSGKGDEAAARWLQLSALSDTVDAAATLLAARHLPKRNVVLALAMATAGAATGFRLSR